MREVSTEVKARRKKCANNSGCCSGDAFSLGLDRAKREHVTSIWESKGFLMMNFY